VQNRQRENNSELKFDLWRIIIRNDFGIVTMTVTNIPILHKTSSHETYHWTKKRDIRFFHENLRFFGGFSRNLNRRVFYLNVFGQRTGTACPLFGSEICEEPEPVVLRNSKNRPTLYKTSRKSFFLFFLGEK
jgi:hypothetical protein